MDERPSRRGTVWRGTGLAALRAMAGRLGLAAAVALPAIAPAATVVSISPQGEVAQVRQVTVQFDSAVVPFGDPRLPDPYAVQCQGASAAGSGRWSSDRVWLYDFKEALPPGASCRITPRAEWKPQGNAALAGAREVTFSTGGPAVLQTRPWDGGTIEEDQHFLLRLSGAATPASVIANTWCEIEGIGERVAVRIVEGAERAAVLKENRIAAAQAPRALLLVCARPLPSATRVRLVWGRGIAAAQNPGVVTRVEQHFSFRVRDAFTAEFTCERERANAPCMPVRPMTVRFAGAVPRAVAEQIVLRPAKGEVIKPRFDRDDKAAEVGAVTFAPPLPENMAFTVELPSNVKDMGGRPLANAASFPLKVATGDAPPIAKFAAAPFGIVELSEPVLPVTLRHVQGDLRPGAPAGQVRSLRLASDEDVIAWHAKVGRFHETRLPAREAGLPPAQWTDTVEETDRRGRLVRRQVPREVETRTVSLLATERAAQRLDLPALAGNDPRPFEVVGIPLPQPGYHVVEIESRRLGEALLDKRAPMFVRTAALVTNLGVHFKLGRESSALWVTTLDRGQPVEGAEVAVRDCKGRPLWSGRTDANGVARIAQALAVPDGCAGAGGLFASARKPVADGPAKGAVDMAFVFSEWQKGIESWRFNQPTASGPEPELRVHTVFDRTLLRAGETVSMKHFARLERSSGLVFVDPAQRPTLARIVHEGSEQEFTVPIVWAGSRSAESSWAIPPAAKLGRYSVSLEREAQGTRPAQRWTSGDFRVEEFRVPLVDARLSAPKAVPIAPAELPLSVQLNHFSGGGMGNAPVRVSALLRPRSPSFAGHEDFSFEPPRDLSRANADEPDDEAPSERGGKLVADKLPLVTDRQGAATAVVKGLPPVKRAQELLAEATFNDPNGEVQTVSTLVPLWPAEVVPGIRAGSWASARGKVKFTALALDTAGRPLAGQALEVRGRLSRIISTRKRIVGGFYAYDNRTEVQELGALCSGKSDSRGLLLCEAELSQSGQVELIASAKDAQGRVAEAATTVWVTRQGELWFSQDNDDRIDVLPEKKRYEPGETARLQVRMPFREATALVAIEREGVIDTRVVRLRGDDPTVEVKIDKAWAPNVYVSVLALRGRIRHVPWYSFFTWGWKAPTDWARAFWYEGREYQAPTAMVDLAKPAFKLGVAGLQVGLAEHALQVSVTADKPQYAVRQTAMARIKVTQGGRPLPAGEAPEIAFAAVDEGLLALRRNDSWNLLDAMLQQRAWGVQTATAQSELIGRRHYGRKAVAAGGGGGRGATRELFDTLLVWKARVPLDANGEATVPVPLNDSLTSFRLVAVADAGPQKFGTGSTSIRVTQDLQLLSGLPPLVREGDRFAAMLTLRNTTARAMTVTAALRGTAASGSGEIVRTPIELPPQQVSVPAGEARELSWPIDVPAEAFSIAWEASAEETGGGSAKDRLKVTQLVSAAVPVRVLQATVAAVDAPLVLPIAPPADALGASGDLRGGVQVTLQPRLTGALPGVRRYFETYPFICLEQKTSKAVGLRDKALWQTVANTLATYLDRDGLANYFPPGAESEPRGSDRLTAYVIAATHEAGFDLPTAPREAMLDGLAAFVEGRIERRFWSPRADLDVRKLAAIEALSRYQRAQPRMLGSINLTPNLWPTAAVIDWLRILKQVPGIPEADKRRAEAQQILRARLTWGGTTLKFSNEQDDFWWWLMDSGDANAARLVLAVLDEPGWREELPRLVIGALGRQRGGAWLTTTANLWGSLALDKFAAKFEAVPVAGRTRIAVGNEPGASVDWVKDAATGLAKGGGARVPWPAQAATLAVTHQGSGRPWATVQSLAAIPLTAPLRAGYAIERSIVAVERKDPARWSRGDVLRVRLEIEAQSDMTWVVVSDPVPGGATLLGSGLGRDSQIATRGERQSGTAWPAFEERSFEAFRSYFEVLPRGKHVVEYTLRLNNAGRFQLPPTRVEAMYAPETFGELPNAALDVAP